MFQGEKPHQPVEVTMLQLVGKAPCFSGEPQGCRWLLFMIRLAHEFSTQGVPPTSYK